MTDNVLEKIFEDCDVNVKFIDCTIPKCAECGEELSGMSCTYGLSSNPKRGQQYFCSKKCAMDYVGENKDE